MKIYTVTDENGNLLSVPIKDKDYLTFIRLTEESFKRHGRALSLRELDSWLKKEEFKPSQRNNI